VLSEALAKQSTAPVVGIGAEVFDHFMGLRAIVPISSYNNNCGYYSILLQNWLYIAFDNTRRSASEYINSLSNEELTNYGVVQYQANYGAKWARDIVSDGIVKTAMRNTGLATTEEQAGVAKRILQDAISHGLVSTGHGADELINILRKSQVGVSPNANANDVYTAIEILSEAESTGSAMLQVEQVQYIANSLMQPIIVFQAQGISNSNALDGNLIYISVPSYYGVEQPLTIVGSPADLLMTVGDFSNSRNLMVNLPAILRVNRIIDNNSTVGEMLNAALLENEQLIVLRHCGTGYFHYEAMPHHSILGGIDLKKQWPAQDFF
jgi:hypothetical protein